MATAVAPAHHPTWTQVQFHKQTGVPRSSLWGGGLSTSKVPACSAWAPILWPVEDRDRVASLALRESLPLLPAHSMSSLMALSELSGKDTFWSFRSRSWLPTVGTSTSCRW